jgi:tRNA-specific 2-thiouridylase
MSSAKKKVLLAMSGGVDSSVAGRLLLEQGYQVTGAFMCLGHGGGDAAARGCCSPQDAADARRVAQALGIEMFVLNLAQEFEPIIADFVAQYTRGRTPNPCIHCNSAIKFGRLVGRADSLGIDYLATGHYARIGDQWSVVSGQSRSPSPRPMSILRARCRAKDQSYALFAIEREHLARMLLPIGELADKAAVRQIARDLGLSVHDKPDSQEICFVENDDYTTLLASRAPQALRGGDIVDTAGKVLGRHEGYARYTIGQRKGLRVAGKEPMYVVAIDPASARVTLGTRAQTMRNSLTAGAATWHCDIAEHARVAGDGGDFRATVQIRYNHSGAPAIVRITGPATFDVRFDEPVMAITPGQAAVIYDGDRLLGGGWID